MGDVLAGLAVFGFFAGVVALLVWQGVRIRRRGSRGAAAAVAPLQEIWHPTAYRSRLETETAEERLAPNPSPDADHPDRRPAAG